MQVIKPVIFLLVLIIFSTQYAQAQACGGGFNSVKVSDSKGKSVRGAVIEIVAQLPREEYNIWECGKVVKISAPDAESAIKRKLPMDFTKDIYCQNPLRQIAGKTKVKKLGEQHPSIENFGFCTGEVYTAPLLLKVSAPNYLTEYYIGNYLGGCGCTYKFVLTKENKKQKNKNTL